MTNSEPFLVLLSPKSPFKLCQTSIPCVNSNGFYYFKKSSTYAVHTMHITYVYVAHVLSIISNCNYVRFNSEAVRVGCGILSNEKAMNTYIFVSVFSLHFPANHSPVFTSGLLFLRLRRNNVAYDIKLTTQGKGIPPAIYFLEHKRWFWLKRGQFLKK